MAVLDRLGSPNAPVEEISFSGQLRLVGRPPDVQNDQLHAYEREMTNGSPSGRTAFLDEVEEALAGE